MFNYIEFVSLILAAIALNSSYFHFWYPTSNPSSFLTRLLGIYFLRTFAIHRKSWIIVVVLIGGSAITLVGSVIVRASSELGAIVHLEAYIFVL